MDGSLLDLNAEDTEAEVEEFWRDMYKLFKLFTTKAKQMKKDRDIGQSVRSASRLIYIMYIVQSQLIFNILEECNEGGYRVLSMSV